jgi:hypothetical protein
MSSLRTAINEYFGSLQFTKVDQKNDLDVWVARVDFGVGPYPRYVLLLVPKQTSAQFGACAQARELPWKNIQTRSLQNEYVQQTQSWHPPSRMLEAIYLQAQKRSACETQYSGAGGMHLLVANDTTQQHPYDLPSHIPLADALTTFRASLSVAK